MTRTSYPVLDTDRAMAADVASTPTLVTVTFQQGVNSYSGCEDTYIHEGFPDENFCASPLLQIGEKDTMATLVKFDVSSIPQNATVIAAQLEIYAIRSSSSLSMTVGFYRIIRHWATCETTWLKATNIMTWGIPGCNDTSSDRVGTPSDTEILSVIDNWYSFNMTDLMQLWVANPDANKGLVLKYIDGPSVEYNFASSQYSAIILRPKLTITYIPPSPAAHMYLPIVVKNHPAWVCKDDYIQDPDFEMGPTGSPWSRLSGGGYELIVCDKNLAFSGRCFAWLGGYNNANDELYQNITVPIPTNSSYAVLSFWYYLYSQDNIPDSDNFTFYIKDPTNGAILVKVAQMDNTHTTGGYMQYLYQFAPADLEAIRRVDRKIQVDLQMTTNRQSPTTILIEDVVLKVCQLLGEK